jgi:eukaryotic-like serine/threonine-protein kinase
MESRRERERCHNGAMAGPDDSTGHGMPFGPFVLERRIAVGGSAEVHLARPKTGTNPAPRLVVKRLISGRTEDQFDVLDHEAELHRAVVHPNVVTVFGAGMVGAEPYLAMEYVEGVDLYRLLRFTEGEQRRLPVGIGVFITRHLAAALAAVHSATGPDGAPLGIVHRDVTPSNVYLSTTGEVKLGDFGIARVSERLRPPSANPGLKGKFAYLAPEQISGDPIDHRVDLFALAAILGEMLIGERVFPGGGQLAVLLAIRDANIEPLRRKAELLPQGLYAICEKALARDPEARFPSAEALSEALESYERPNAEDLRRDLASLVRQASDPHRLVQQIRDSVERMRAVARRTPPIRPAPESVPPVASVPKVMATTKPVPPPRRVEDVWRVRRADGRLFEKIGLPRLLELVATGELDGNDEVAFFDGEFRKIDEIPELARHLLPSTTQTTRQLFRPGAPDYRAMLGDTPMMEVLAQMRQQRDTGALFAERADRTGAPQRKELYLKAGRLHYVASSDRTELLGEYLVRRQALTREQLDAALASIAGSGGRLGDTLVGLGFVEAVDVFRAIRDQGRDRVAAICGWRRGSAMFYRGAEPPHVEFPLDLDLSSPMMAGAIVQSQGNPRALLPDDSTRLNPGPRHYAAFDPGELGTAPVSLRAVPKLAGSRLTVGEALAGILRTPAERRIGDKEAAAALVAAKAIGWVEY